MTDLVRICTAISPSFPALLAAVLLTACGGSETVATEHAPAPPSASTSAEASAPTSDGSVEECSVSVECASALAAAERFEETRTGATREAACRAAGDAVRAVHACALSSVDGMSVLWLRTAANDPPPGTLAREVGCEVEIARAASEETTGRGAGTTDEAAVSAAIQAACSTIGETDCSLARGFFSDVRTRRTSTQFADGVMVSNTEVEVALWRIVVAPGRGTSLSSGAEACANAYRAACGDEGCGERERIVSVDGITVMP